jgi:hypothetical protein
MHPKTDVGGRMGLTPVYQLPYPEPTDPADVPIDMRELAERVEAVLQAQPVPAMQRIADQVLAAPATTFDFQNIPQTFTSLRVVLYGRSDQAGAQGSVVQLRFNNDSGAAYAYLRLQGTGGAAGVGEIYGVTNAEIGAVPAATAPANLMGLVEVLVPGYRNTTYFKQVHAVANEQRVPSGGLVVRHYGGGWYQTAAINRLTLICTGGNFMVGSRATLYGMT